MLAQHYAQALCSIGGDGQGDTLASNLIGVLKEKGHYHLLPTILAEYKKLVGEKDQKNAVRIRVKDRTDLENFKDDINVHAEKLLFDVNAAEVVEDPSIVGGFVIEKGEQEVDASYRRNLVALYKRLMAIDIQNG